MGKVFYKPGMDAVEFYLLQPNKTLPLLPLPASPAGCVESGENVTNTTYVFSRKNLKRYAVEEIVEMFALSFGSW